MRSMETLLTLLMLLFPSDGGRLSVYWPGDGFNAGRLACGGAFTIEQDHIAYRGWRKVGCNRPVLVCAVETGGCALSRVRDAGPFGIYSGRMRGARAERRWRVFTGPGRPPAGWRYRAVVDLSRRLWLRLGKPRGLSQVRLIFLPRDSSVEARRWLRALGQLLQPTPVV